MFIYCNRYLTMCEGRGTTVQVVRFTAQYGAPTLGLDRFCTSDACAVAALAAATRWMAARIARHQKAAYTRVAARPE